MAISLQCEQCGKQYQLADNLAGKRVKCQQCGAAMAVPGNAAAGQKPAAGKAKTPAAASPAAPKAAAPAPRPMTNLIEEEFAAGAMPTLLGAGQIYCPKCKAIIPGNAVLCVHCGYKLESGRMTVSQSEANRKVRKPGTLTPGAVISAILGLLYSLVAIFVFGMATFGAAVILWKLGLPSEDNPQSAVGMFGGPVFLLLFTAGCLLFISSINILRKVKGAIPNAVLASKIFVGSFILGVILGFASTIYQGYMAKKPAEGQAAAQAEKKDEAAEPPVTFTGPAAMLLDTSMALAVTAAIIIQVLLTLGIVISPPLFILIWGGTQGKKLDWEFPEPVYKATRKGTGAPPDAAKKPPEGDAAKKAKT